ncbi:Ltp family lipoprotein [Lysinibacillus xylanilyticus]|uniref:Ltp family lipoprotein n=1 Tax=Lysinibacillus xylanilyticus TaxID=582475 RepID=UPI00382776F8
MKKFFKFGCGGIIALIILGVIIGALGGGDDSTKNKSDSTDKKIETSAKPQENAEESKEASVPREYKSALKKAESYAKTMKMSKAGIFDQLTSEHGENFPVEAAQYAIDNIVFDWKENALKKAQSYSETMNMSDSAIYDQLISEYGEKFTPEEAQYAIDNLK